MSLSRHLCMAIQKDDLKQVINLKSDLDKTKNANCKPKSQILYQPQTNKNKDLKGNQSMRLR